MKTGVTEALLLTLVMGVVIFFCRLFPFLFFREKTGAHSKTAFLNFVEKTVPPVAMTVLAFNSMAGPIKGNLREALPVLTAAALTALLLRWKRNPLISIFGGPALYMILERVIAK
jgi:branched-subunit amino acid transport protein AzlD